MVANRRVVAQYSGRLNPTQAAEGIQAALKNARALLADAQLLLENERWQRATALSILAIEEAGKIPLVRGILLARDDKESREAWRSYRSLAIRHSTQPRRFQRWQANRRDVQPAQSLR